MELSGKSFTKGVLEAQAKVGTTASKPIPPRSADGDGKRPAVPGSNSRSDAFLPLVLDPNNVEAVEAFSILRSRLLGLHSKLGTRSVIITSSDGGDGKTLVATNLALSLGALGTKRVLLIDGDLRAGTATGVLNLKNQPGIGEFLQGKRPFTAVIHPTQFANLSVAPTGYVPKNALPALLERPQWSEFIGLAKEQFDLIVIDSLPVSARVADLELLMAPCDGYLLVVHMRQTRRQSLKRVSSRLDMTKCLGVILNNDAELDDYSQDYYYLGSKYPK